MYRVLVADDEPIERMIVARTIKKYFSGQLEVVEAVNGREAAKFFTEKDCQIALLDIEMPGVNGLEAAGQIREKNRDCSIIFLTAFDEFNYAKRAISVHALDYLLKPGTEEELVTVLEEAIRLLNERTDGLREDRKEILPEKQEKKKDVQPESGNIRMSAVAENIRQYISMHYKEDISLQSVAEEMNYSDAYFCKIFKQCFDKSFIVYLTEFRMEQAILLITGTEMSFTEIAEKVGFTTSRYFSTTFKQYTGETPTQYKEKHKRETSKTINQ